MERISHFASHYPASRIPHRAAGASAIRHSLFLALRRRLAGKRQIIETVFDMLHNASGLRRERPHCPAGWPPAWALHNFCIYLNRLPGRPSLTFADLVDW